MKIGSVVATVGLFILWSMVQVDTIFWFLFLGGVSGLGLCAAIREVSDGWRPVALGYVHGLVLPGLWVPAYNHDGWYLLTGIGAMLYLVVIGLLSSYTYGQTEKAAIGLVTGLVIGAFILYGGIL